MLVFFCCVAIAAVLAYRLELQQPIPTIETEAPWWRTRFDRRAARWPRPFYWTYLVFKWYLAAAGGFALGMYYLHRLGLPSLWPS